MDKLAGRTYSLPLDGDYFAYIAKQLDKLAAEMSELTSLDELLTKLVAKGLPFKRKHKGFESIFAKISTEMSAAYTPKLADFLASLSPKPATNKIFKISIRGYHLRMLHIEALNRLMHKDFLNTAHKVVILPHCLRDFSADKCRFKPGDADYVCLGCTEECLINKTSILLKDYPNYHLYISQVQDLKKVFNLARKRYKDIGLLGVACIPELYEGMSISRKMYIPAQGVPLNYNRCARWMREAHYTNFNLSHLQKIIDPSMLKTKP